jgi:SAM-dependent methyltransferase
LNPVEIGLLGDIRGKRILHLQCHFGQDTISLAREGAKVTGVDLSDKAIQKAKEIAEKCEVDASFICCDIFDLPNHLEEQFDIVFTSYGVIGWLPDLDKWAGIVSRFLKPDGHFVFVEFHPVVWMFDDDFEKIEYNYFNSGAMVEIEDGTYADREARISQEFIVWNHSMSEVVNSLIKNGLRIDSFEEFDYSPYNCFKHTVEFEPKKYRIRHLENKIPMIFAIRATRR